MVFSSSGLAKVFLKGSTNTTCDSEESIERNKKPALTKLSAIQWNRIVIFRALLAISLVMTGIVSGTMSWWLLRERENEKYKSEFFKISDEVFTAVDEGVKSKLQTMESMSSILSYECPTTDIWPNCSMPLIHYQDLLRTLLSMSKSFTLDTSPLVRPHQQTGFEAFAYEFFEREGFPAKTGISDSFGKGIYSRLDDENATRYHDNGITSFSKHDVMLPVFQPSSITLNWPAVMYNMHSDPTPAAAIDEVIDCVIANNNTQLSGTSIVRKCSAITDFVLLGYYNEPSPFSTMFSPIFPRNDNTTLVGMNTLLMGWTDVLSTAGLNYGKLDVVVEAHRDGVTVSRRHFELNSGMAKYICNTYQRSQRSGMRQSSYDIDYGRDDPMAISYKLHFYTTPGFVQQYCTVVPILGAIVCAGIIIFISGLFIAYDVLVKRESLENRLLLESKRIFVKFISHEIRTPINTVTLGLQLLANRLLELEDDDAKRTRDGDISFSQRERKVCVVKPTVEECVDLVKDMTESSGTAVTVLNDLINYDKVQLKKFQIERRLCNVYSVIQSTVKPMEVLATSLDVELVVSVFDGSAFLIGDEIKLGQVIRNVLSNALKFTPSKGSVYVNVNWDKKVKDTTSGDLLQYDPDTGDEYTSSGIVTIKVTDTGPGLSSEQLQNMFQEGVQFNPNELQRGQGSGLGLWISRAIIEQHGGTITVTSEGLGKGATFNISLPVVLPTVNKSSAFNSSNQATCSHEIQGQHLLQLPIRVLVVDDSKLNAKMLSRLLQTAGMKVTMVHSGQECIRTLSDPRIIDNSFDLIVMDFIMPEMSGPDTTRTLRASGHQLPVIGVTGNVLPEDIRCFMAAGANAVFPKPIILSTFLEACKDLVLNSQDSESSTLRNSSEMA